MRQATPWIAALLLAAALVPAALVPARADTLGVVSPQKGSWENSAAEFGQRLGYFKDVGLDLNLLFINGGGESQQAVISGSADIGLGTGILALLGAVTKGAPLKIISNSFIGANDSYWYVKADSPIQSLKQAAGHTVGFSTPGSSSNLNLLAVLDALGVKGAKPIATGNPSATMTQVMSGQVDIGYSVAPFALPEIGSGQLRIVGRGSEAPELAKQSVRVIFVNSHVLAERRDAVVRFMKALRRSLAWMYSDDPRVMQWYAEGAGVPVDIAQRSRAEFDPASAVALGPPIGLETSMREAVQFKYVRAPLTDAELASYVDVIDGK